MYGKIFKQIFASSIAHDYKVRHFFMDLIVLAEPDGVVDMTSDAISGVTGIPIDDVRSFLSILEKPDKQSRSQDLDGARIVRLDSHRNWGWKIVNYLRYRQIATNEQRKEGIRDRVLRHRNNSQLLDSEASNTHVTPEVLQGVTPITLTLPLTLPKEEGVVRGRFQKPTLEMMKLHGEKISLPPDQVEACFDYYESNGWRVGKNPMKLWTAAMANWKRNYESGIYRNKISGGTRSENPRNVGNTKGVTDYPAVVRRKQAEALEREMAAAKDRQSSKPSESGTQGV